MTADGPFGWAPPGYDQRDVERAFMLDLDRVEPDASETEQDADDATPTAP